LKDISEGKSLQWAKYQTIHFAVHFTWKEKIQPDVRIYTDSWTITNDLSGWLENWEVHDWKIRDKDTYQKEYYKWVKDVKVFVSHVNVH
jgi:ribonuclease HI